jgi:PKD repeat protein
VIDRFELASLANPLNTSSTTMPSIAIVLDAADPDGGIVRWLVREGDGSTPTAQVMRASGVSGPPTSFTLHQTTGIHTVFMWVMDDDGNISGAAATIDLLGNAPPVAAITPLSSTVLEAPAEVAFDAAGSFDPDGSALEYYWDFGDQTTSALVGPTHTYSNVGTYTVRLVVTDDQGRTGVDTVQITVLDTVAPVIDAESLTLRGRVDTTAVSAVQVEVDGVPAGSAGVVDGSYEVVVLLTGGARTITVKLVADDGAVSTTRTFDIDKDGP